MRNYLLFFIAVWAFASPLFAGTALPNSAPTVYEQLCALNKQWQKVSPSDPLLQQVFAFADHEQLIRFHLMTVENTLRNKSVSYLSPTQVAHRQHCLAILNAYWKTGIFPKNTHHSVTIPYFIDDFNTACAVGHLIRETGGEKLACRIASEMNYAYIEQMPYPEIGQWASIMGFEVEELKWIQPAYSPPYTVTKSINDAECGVNNGNASLSFTDPITGQPSTAPQCLWYLLNGQAIGLVSEETSIENVQSGVYKVSNGDGGMFGNIEMVGISDIDAPIISANIQHESCMGSSDGRIELLVSGGTPPYTYTWYDSYGRKLGTESILDGLMAKNGAIVMYYDNIPQFTVEVKDANACRRVAQYTLEALHQGVYAFSNNIPPSCGESNGSIQVYAGGTGAITYNWLHDPNLQSATANNLPAGHYVVEVSDENACTYTHHIDLNSADMANASFYPTTGADYCGQGLGFIEFPPTNGLSYQWSHDATLTTNRAENLLIGTYSVTISNAQGCKAFQTVQIYNGYYNATSPILANANSHAGVLGSIDLQTGTGYTYQWSHDLTLNAPQATNLSAGNYAVTVSQNGCHDVLLFEIYDETVLGVPDILPVVFQEVQGNGNTLQVSIHNPTGKALSLSLYDVTGRQMAQASMTSEQIAQCTMPIAQLSAGVYLLQASNGKMQSSVKWVKTN